MPYAPPRPCTHPRCPERQPCPVHARQQALAKEHRRTNRDVRRWYYLAKWVHPDWGLRAQVLSDNPWCVQCQQRGILELATDVDHIVPHDSDPDRFWDRGNLQGLCRGCHTRKTRAGQ
jgi:5-methylcytosine-specific restriction protein A